MWTVEVENRFDDWRDAARALLHRQVPPALVRWRTAGEGGLPLGELFEEREGSSGSLSVPTAFVELAKVVACHRAPERWPTLYRVLWRITRGEKSLLEIDVDDDVRPLRGMEKQVRFDAHKMKAFVRFRKVRDGEGERYVAWHRPEHAVLRMTAPFFADRFAVMRWSVLTPGESAHWDGERLEFGPGVARSAAPSGDELEGLWKSYYASTFNPARIKLAAMKKEMPAKYWSTMPETELIPDLLADAPRRVKEMEERQRRASVGAESFVPKGAGLTVLREEVRACRGCDLYRCATQAVFGEGPADAVAVFVGEQPGDQEDQVGRPFVGPAGKVLDEALAEAGIDRSSIYVTNTVKHFKFEPRGEKRIHAKPNAREVKACVAWLEAEVSAIRPKVIVCLGSTAAQAMFGAAFRVTRDHGKVFAHEWAPKVVATIHPSALLRMPDERAREAARRRFIEDLRVAATLIEEEREARLSGDRTRSGTGG